MRKILFCAFFLVCFSAFAFKPKYGSTTAISIQKTAVEQPKKLPDSIIDMVMFPHLGM